jgi:hypothetical protein
MHLHEISDRRPRDPSVGAPKLIRVTQESFPLDETLALPFQRILAMAAGFIA